MKRVGFDGARVGLWAVGLSALLSACGPAVSIDRVSQSVSHGGGSGQGSGGAGGEGGAGGALQTGGTGGGAGGLGGAGGAGGGAGGAGGGAGGNNAEPDAGNGGAPGTGGSDAGAMGGTGGADVAFEVAADLVSPDDGGPINRPEPSLMVTHAIAGASTNLTSAGKLDWVHFGYNGASVVNRKKTVPALITMKKLGSQTLAHYDNRPVTFSWSDGMPTTRVTDISDGVVTGNVTGVGFELTVIGSSARPRTLVVHVGGWQAEARLTAQLAGTTGYSNTSFRATNPGADRVYTIVFQPANDNDTLVVRWTMTDVLAMYGNVTLQAASLSE